MPFGPENHKKETASYDRGNRKRENSKNSGSSRW
jgi:hypothetical protein